MGLGWRRRWGSLFPPPPPLGRPQRGKEGRERESASHTQMQPEGGGGGIAVGERPTSFFFPPFFRNPFPALRSPECPAGPKKVWGPNSHLVHVQMLGYQN